MSLHLRFSHEWTLSEIITLKFYSHITKYTLNSLIVYYKFTIESFYLYLLHNFTLLIILQLFLIYLFYLLKDINAE